MGGRRGREGGWEGGQIVTLTGALARAAVELTQSFQVQLSSRGINISGQEMRRMLKIEMHFFYFLQNEFGRYSFQVV